ncbi:hypothetical protein JTE90_026992 [Oedothorax gibbosus]|uniref:Ig-like domain-containing protein n=1 Tax=Oedothorax gibbosus TaxID=931172 RepID=A0AAV6TU39_9ARAC|nr:hypothetical protein JTE90_026992 [Oedothorax gibbosus]
MNYIRRSIGGNPLSCNCSAKWLQKLASRGPLRDQVTCEEGGERVLLMNVTIPHCELPRVSVMPEKLILNESQSADIICSATGDPPLSLYWDTSSLTSNLSVGNFELSENSTTGPSLNYFDTNHTFLVLPIYSANAADNGVVPCVAENDVGQDIAEVTLEIIDSELIGETTIVVQGGTTTMSSIAIPKDAQSNMLNILISLYEDHTFSNDPILVLVVHCEF